MIHIEKLFSFILLFIALPSPASFIRMSSIYKLSIKGVRAFHPESDETIQFGFPLTLICGQNGCGKTTVIECLKYATTGTLPPNSKGGAFVHDPSLSSRTAVTGQIKLAFKNVNGKSMITTRSVQASLKSTKSATGATVTFKTLEGQLAIIEKDDLDLHSFNKDRVPSLLQNEVFSDDEDDDIEYEGRHDSDHINLTEDEFEEDISRTYFDSTDSVKSNFFQTHKFKTVPVYCSELLLLEYLSFYSPSFSKSTLKLCIFCSIGLDIFVVERTKLRTMLFLLISVVLSILLAYELGHLNPYIV